MNLRQLEFFVTLAKLEHMTQAAKALSTTQPNLSHSMSELEKELGVPLFEKQGRNIVLTKYGKFFHSYVERSLNELSMGEQALKEWVSPTHGHISFGFIYTMGATLAPLLLQSFKCLPENEHISFSLHQGTTNQMIQQLLDEEIDLALCSLKEENPRIAFQKIVQQELVLMIPINHPLAQYSEVSLAQIAHYAFVGFSQKSGLRPVIDQLFEHAQVPLPNIVLEIDEDHTIAGFVQHGFGIAIVPNLSTFASFQINILKIKDISFKRYIYLARLKDKYLSPTTLKFHDFIINYTACRFLAKQKFI